MRCPPVDSFQRPSAAAVGGGFTIIELLVAISIVAMILAVSVPATGRLYKTMQYREAVRDVITLFASARYKAVSSGRAQDVKINPRTRQLSLNSSVKTLPSALNVVVHSARELNETNVGVIRFYPEGGSSGGGVDLEIPDRWGVRINVDWLIGSVSQEKYALD